MPNTTIDLIVPVAPWDDIEPPFAAQFAGYRSGCLLVTGPKPPAHLSRMPNAQFVPSPLGRARQLNAAAHRAKADYLWFVHADTILPESYELTLHGAIAQNPEALLYFDLGFSQEGPKLMALNAAGVWFRSHVLQLPFGDQALCLPQKTFWQLGGFSEQAAYGEDHLLVWQAHQKGVPLRPVGAKVTTSARKYQNKGWATTTLQHVHLTIRQALPEAYKVLRRRRSPS